MRYRRADGVAFEVVDGRAVLLDPAGAELITLNPVGTLVWEDLGEGQDRTTIVGGLSKVFADVSPEQLSADVDRFLAELAELGLVSRTDAGG